MPHTHSRYQQDLGFSDGMISFDAEEFIALSLTGTAPALTRNAIGDIAYNLPASSSAYFDLNIVKALMRRSGFFEDTQNQFGSTFGGGLGGELANPGFETSGTGIPGSAEPQGRPQGYILPGAPQPASGMGTLQEITPRTAFKLKGIKPKSINVIYKVLTGAMTTLTCSLTETTFANNQTVVSGQTTLLASGANGLTNAAQTNLYVVNIPLPLALFYQITPLTQLWFELDVVAPASNSFQLYGIELVCDFNYN